MRFDYFIFDEVLVIYVNQIEIYGGVYDIWDFGVFEVAVVCLKSGYYFDLIVEVVVLWESLV